MTQQHSILFGAAYYDEYMPYDRLDEDVKMLKAAHMNTVRIAESTWSTMEPRSGEFDFSHVDRVLDAMEKAGISVIIGTPTYAIPVWLAHRSPEILVRQHAGQRRYGPRQIIDILNTDFRVCAERIIRELIGHVAHRKCVIGFQIDNETKYYDALNEDVQHAFAKQLRQRFDGDLEAMNNAFGLAYWSNRITDWDEFPDLTETINASLSGAFDRFRRSVVSDYLAWQSDIVREYARDDQFVTHNHDLEWRGYSYGVQPWADHFKNAQALDYAGVDIYHPTEDHLTGREIAFGGDLTRSLKHGKNYLVLETQAQGQNGWLPYPGQLRLQAYSHLASGSNSVMYWHWHSIHHSFESYWKGVLSHDFEANPVYEEAKNFGEEISRIGDHLVNLHKRNKVAIIISNEALSALNRFAISTGFPKPSPYEEGDSSGLVAYNDVVRWMYDAFFDLNIEVDFLPADCSISTLERYELLVAPALYCTSQVLIDGLKTYVEHGGHLLATFKSFFTDEDVSIWNDLQPHGLTDVFGMDYGEFTLPEDVPLVFGRGLEHLRGKAQTFMELVRVHEGADVLAKYQHDGWKEYAAITRNAFGKGWAQWIGTMTSPEVIREIIRDAAFASGVNVRGMKSNTDIAIRRGSNDSGRTVTYLFNYSSRQQTFASPYGGTDLLESAPNAEAAAIREGEEITLAPWGLKILES
ncbi:beta-galactosidase [Bifidobacterium psychraerophilum]|uniref:beta-galactosidase n=1 Tax=Bifidobacterium psychraerophilum TaxID=218140 RepID=A0A087CJ72_9BIFI|nr:beta-galactosidase [Bifidobacterium psychraerophilum]KFI83322.1 beta-galactosidase [Bifidobacterium psychraerophilum]PKA94376.1 beta-galactosidase [Bifidobacterium psychraerophilum DSM 22366]